MSLVPSSPALSRLSGGVLSVLGIACLATGASAAPANATRESHDNPAHYALTAADNALLDDLQRTGFQFFVEQSHPVTGLVRDRARADGAPTEGKASIAASGFAFPAWVIAVERGWTTREEAVERIREKLRFVATGVPRQQGFYYHFLEMDTGARAWQCELSSIDSAILYAGAIVVREYFADPEITELVKKILADVNWNWFRNGGDLVSLGWHDETGFSRYRWNKYSEHVLMSFLALGVSDRPLDASYWTMWHRYPLGRYGDAVYLQEPPLFVNQFPHAFIDVRGKRDAFANYFHNTRLATLAQRQFSLDLRAEFPAWGENVWGLTASDSATGYKAWGGPPRTLRYNALDGSIVPCAAAGSLPFAPQETLAVLHHLKNVYGDRIWKRYGFVDAFNPHNDWVNPDVLGIDIGISVVQAENLRTGLIQRLFMQAPEAQLSLTKAGFLSVARELDPAQQQQLLAHARAAWTLLQKDPATAGLQLTALIAAHEMGFLNANDFLAAAKAQLATAPAVDAPYAASLLTLRQAVPALAAEATRAIEKINWETLPSAAAGSTLSTSARLAAFLQIAAKVAPASQWSALDRTTKALGPVQVLYPVDVTGATLPALWLDERAVLSGASAAQLAYASLTGVEVPASPLLAALQLDHFPQEVLRADRPLAPATSPEAAAAAVITAANLIGHDSLRRAFQQDPIVQAGRAAIAEFSEAAFGSNTSVIAQRELSGIPPVPAARKTVAVANSLPREQRDWQTVAGLEFKESEADVRAEDPPLGFRFALTWDAEALYFHAEITDATPGFTYLPTRNRITELFVDPAGDGLVWTGANDYQFSYRVGKEGAKELFHQVPNSAVITETADGYTVEARIPWTSIGLTPKPGLEFAVSAAVTSEGTREWEPNLRLNWSSAHLRPGESRLGLVQLK